MGPRRGPGCVGGPTGAAPGSPPPQPPFPRPVEIWAQTRWGGTRGGSATSGGLWRHSGTPLSTPRPPPGAHRRGGPPRVSPGPPFPSSPAQLVPVRGCRTRPAPLPMWHLTPAGPPQNRLTPPRGGWERAGVSPPFSRAWGGGGAASPDWGEGFYSPPHPHPKLDSMEGWGEELSLGARQPPRKIRGGLGSPPGVVCPPPH